MAGRDDLRGVLAGLTLVAVFGYAFALLVLDRRALDVPVWMVSTAALVTGHYFGAKNEVGHRDAARDEARDPARDEAHDAAKRKAGG